MTGQEVQICAPGVEIESTAPGNKYVVADGTSAATAIVSGAAALVRAKFPNLTAQQVIHRLTSTATDIGPPGRDEECGFGSLNIVKALTADIPAENVPSSQPSQAPQPTPGESNVPAPDNNPASSNVPAILGGIGGLLLAGGSPPSCWSGADGSVQRRQIRPTETETETPTETETETETPTETETETPTEIVGGHTEGQVSPRPDGL